jgi:SAM-dependent methyltransferase
MSPPGPVTRSCSYRGKQKLVAELLRHRTGSVLDIGARDQILRSNLDQTKWRYMSADLDGEHDYRIDLERALPIPDKTFDCVVAMDVLEHVDGLHAAFREVLRVSRRWVVIGLPNMGSFVHRLSMLFAGRPATAKYDLTIAPVRDRHRWYLKLDDVDRFMESAGVADGYALREVIYEAEGERAVRVIGVAAMRLSMRFRFFFAKRGIYLLERTQVVTPEPA